MATQMAEAAYTASDPDNYTGYRTFQTGGFGFRRDEYFAHITWPEGSHLMPVDAFLRALVRVVAWNFFYGTINFDDVFGTTNPLRPGRALCRALQRCLPRERPRLSGDRGL